jgi:hypothetical protein
MKRWMHALSLTAAAAALVGCSTTYKPMSVDAATGLYDTRTAVDPGGVTVAKNRVNPAEFGAVILLADSNQFPSRLEFVARRALADMGYTRVVTVREWREWAADSRFPVSEDDKVTGAVLRDFSQRVKPLLIVDVRYAWVGGSRHLGALRVIDGRNLQQLLTVSHPKVVWMNVDDEVIYPVLNELRKWHRQMTTSGA